MPWPQQKCVQSLKGLSLTTRNGKAPYWSPINI
jgi:hypothetical protein